MKSFVIGVRKAEVVSYLKYQLRQSSEVSWTVYGLLISALR